MANGILHNRRIVVTRSPQQAPALCQKLAERGATPLRFPVIQFNRLPAPSLATDLAALTNADWLVFTSVNAVEFFEAALNGMPPTVAQVAAVGSATCEALQRRQVAIDLVPAQFTGVQLATELGDLRGRNVLLPRARAGRPEIVALLQAAGATVRDIPLYDTVRATPSAESLNALGDGYDMVTFTSPSSVRNFFDLLDAVPDVPYATIGPVTSAELHKFGRMPAAQATPYTIDGLVDAVTNFFESREREKRKSDKQEQAYAVG